MHTAEVDINYSYTLSLEIDSVYNEICLNIAGVMHSAVQDILRTNEQLTNTDMQIIIVRDQSTGGGGEGSFPPSPQNDKH